ncbi:MAG: OsmC family protein [Flavobacteriales bacterium]|nr:OsmC family protein [Flavobacteriales bacterium]
MTSKVSYLGNLRTSCIHLASGTTIITDAPIDNHGKGEAFSPTDLVATSLASCMITIMGIYCQEHGIEFAYCEASVLKVMASSPRRIERVLVEMDLNGNNWDEKIKNKVIAAGKTCPVARTLEGNVELEFIFK